MTESPAQERGRRSFAERRWRAAFEALSEADHAGQLGADDLARLGEAAYLAGADDAAIAAWTRAHHALVERGDRPGAARVGIWLSLTLLVAGKMAQSSGWLSRSERLLSDASEWCTERGFVLAMTGVMSLVKGESAAACASFEQATAVALRSGDADLLGLSVLGHGQVLVQMQRRDDGLVLLDEAMVAVTSGQVSPIVAGIIYCAVIRTCERTYDLERAHEWTVALDRWCAAQPELVAFRGDCLVHHCELLQLDGDWDAAMTEARRACELLSARSERLAGRALYRLAELHRLHGQLEHAETLYREAGEKGFEPQPGSSLLRLAQGKPHDAAAAIRRVASEAGASQALGAGTHRVGILGPFVEIMLAVDDVDAAGAAADELSAIAHELAAPYLVATAAQARGAVLLVRGEPERALAALREAWTFWQKLGAPYEAARVRVLVGRACERLGDTDTARLHIDAAVAVFERLGATADLAGLRRPIPRPVADLSAREREVLALVASGRTNRQIAGELGISEHTVARHISNIFHKIGVSSRTAASAFAFEHGLV